MTISVKLKHDNDLHRVRLGSSDPHIEQQSQSYDDILSMSFEISASDVSLKYRDGADKVLSVSGDRVLEEAINSPSQNNKVVQFTVADKNTALIKPRPFAQTTTAPCSPSTYSLRLSSPSVTKTNPLSKSEPVTTHVSTTSNSTTLESPPPQDLIKRFHDLIKYINIPDVLHGLENFGYLSSDQSVELFEIIQQIRHHVPELYRVLQYEDTERPVCTVQHIGVTCDSCFTSDFKGNRYKCAICPDFDMCETCERKGVLTHDITHPRIKMLVPSDCAFAHACQSHNAQGELKEEVCQFALALPPTSPALPGAPVYQKRQLQFSTLLKKKQMRDIVRKAYTQEKERLRQEILKEEEVKRQAEKKQNESKVQAQVQSPQKPQTPQASRQSPTPSQKTQPSKGFLSAYFENLKKQNRHQNITVESPEKATEPVTTPEKSGIVPKNAQPSPVVADSTPSSIPLPSPTPLVLSPPVTHSISSSAPVTPSPLSPSSTPIRTPSSLRSVKSTSQLGPISSRLTPQKFGPSSPECSPMTPRLVLTESVGSPVLRRASSLGNSTVIPKEEIKFDQLESTPEKNVESMPEKNVESTPEKNVEKTEKPPKRNFGDMLRDIGIWGNSSDEEDEDDDDSVYEEYDEEDYVSELSISESTEIYAPQETVTKDPSPKKESSFFSSIRELLK